MQVTETMRSWEFLNKHTTGLSDYTLLSCNNLQVCYYFFDIVIIVFNLQLLLSLLEISKRVLLP